MNVCIVGSSRCGTTMLCKLLHEHPDLSLFNETHWLPKMVEFFGHQSVPGSELLEVAKKTTWDTGKDLFEVNAEYSPYETGDELLEQFSRRLQRSGNVTIQQFSSILAEIAFGDDVSWGDKTPDYGYYMEMIQNLWPQCRFIHIVRDGISTARSMLSHSGCQLMIPAGYDNWCSLSYDSAYSRYDRRELGLDECIKSWRRRIARIRDESRRLRPKSYIEVRYLDVLDDPGRTLRIVAEFLDLQSDQAWIEAAEAQVNRRKKTAAVGIEDLLRLAPADLQALHAEYPLALGEAADPISRGLSLVAGGHDLEKGVSLIMAGLSENDPGSLTEHWLEVSKQIYEAPDP